MQRTIQDLVRQNIRTLKPYSSARSEFKGVAEVFLDANENPFDTGLNRYPDPLQWKLKEKISQLKGVPKENVFLGNGSDEVIDLLIRIFCEPQEDHIIILPPTYGMYQVSADIANIAVLKIPLVDNFQPDVPTILEAAGAHSKLLFLCSPNNPTGNSFDQEKVLELIKQFPGIVVMDEAYIDFAAQASFLEQLEQYPNLVVMQTFSKAWGMAGIRLGMGFASTEIVGLFNKVKPPYNINQLTQEAALDQLEQVQATKEGVAKILQERAALTDALQELSYVQTIHPSETNFILVKLDDPKAVYDYLVGEKIIVRNRSTVLLCAGCLRITIGKPEENEKLLQTLKRYS